MPQFVGLLLVIAITFFLFNLSSSARAETVNISANSDQQVQDLQEQAALKKLEIEKIQKKLDVYQQDLASKQAEKLTLQNELESLSAKIKELELEMEKVNLQIDTTNLEIQAVLLQILDKEELIARQKTQLAEMLRLINMNDQKGYLEILVSNKTFSDFFDQVTQLEQVQANVQKYLDEVKTLKIELQAQQQDLEKKSGELNGLKDQLEGSKVKLDQQESAKTYYLLQAKNSEKKFQSLIAQARADQQKINNDITSIEKTIRQKLNQTGEKLQSTGQFIWPVPGRTITAYFHDADFIFSSLFAHSAIDIRTPQGTPIRAADTGYVAKAQDGGARGYSYIMIIHDNGLATVYGHVSKIYVQPDTQINQGDIIGLSGGTPGTHGAGPYTTGAHLHFEVRLNGIPVNPLDYL